MEPRPNDRLELKGKGEYFIVFDTSNLSPENSIIVVLYYGNKRLTSFTLHQDVDLISVMHLPFAKDLSIKLTRQTGPYRNVPVQVYKKILWFWKKVADV